jgi:hypothetical protein
MRGVPGSRPFLMFSPVTPVLWALAWISPYSKRRQVLIVLCQRGHPLGRTFRFPIREPALEPVHFPLDLTPSFAILLTYTYYLQDNMFFDNLTSTNHPGPKGGSAKTLREHDNPNV